MADITTLKDLPRDARCEIYGKLTNIVDIKNIIKAYPKFAKEIYLCVLEIREHNPEDNISVTNLLKFTKLKFIEIPIIVETEKELERMAYSNLDYLHIQLGKQFGSNFKGHDYIKFMQTINKFINLWVGNNTIGDVVDEDILSDIIPSHLAKIVIIERLYDGEIVYTNDKGIRFIYNKGSVNIYKNNIGYPKTRKIMYNLIELFDKNNALDDLKIFTKIYPPDFTQEDIRENKDFFGYQLDGLKSVGVSLSVEEEIGFWLSTFNGSKQVNRIYFIPIRSFSFIGLSTPISWGKFNNTAHIVINEMAAAPDNEITELELPLRDPNIQTILAAYPNIKVIGLLQLEITEKARIKKITDIANKYPNLNFVIFPYENEPELPVLDNVSFAPFDIK
jgi:hypothetical protein